MTINGHRLPTDVWAFLDDVLVECPRCGGLAHVLMDRGCRERARLACGTCGHSALGGPHLDFSYASMREGRDPIFKLPLWLREPVGKGVVWAYNWRHYEDLRFFYEGDWRDHRHHLDLPGHQSTWSWRTRLPQWMQMKANRPTIVRALNRIRKRRLGLGKN